MDDEPEFRHQPPMQQQQIPQAIRAGALMMTGEFILIIGILFVLLGMGAFITDFLKIKGSGEILVGLFLCAVSMVFFILSGSQIPKPRMQAAGRPAIKKSKTDDSGSYR